MNVSQHLAAAFQIAASQNAELHNAWITISHRIGSRLPASLLPLSIQHIGRLDMLLRCMENDLLPLDQLGERDPFSFQMQVMLSELWIGSVYEVFRLLKDRKLVEETDNFKTLAHDLRLVRVSLEKHEIAGDRKLSQPLTLQRVPPRGDEADLYLYSAGDAKRAHIMPTGVSARGSQMWQVVDVGASESYWVERLNSSERVIDLWSPGEDEPPGALAERPALPPD